MEINLIIIFIMLIMCISMFAYTISRYKKCPPGKILVVYGQTGGAPKYITNGGIFILPIIQNYTYLDLAPMAIDIVLKNALSLDNTRIDISIKLKDFRNIIITIMELLTSKKDDYENALYHIRTCSSISY